MKLYRMRNNEWDHWIRNYMRVDGINTNNEEERFEIKVDSLTAIFEEQGLRPSNMDVAHPNFRLPESSKVARVNLASFKWKDAEDNKNCSALESETSSLSVMHIHGKCSPFRLPNSSWWTAISESIKGDTQRYRAMVKGGWSAGKTTSPGFPATPAQVAQVGSNCSSQANRQRISISPALLSSVKVRTSVRTTIIMLTRGKEPLSFISQTATLYDSTFSYCLPSLFSSAFTWSLLLGKGALSASGLKFTPLLSNARYPYFYYVGLNGISVGDELVSIPAGTLTLDQSTGRGTIIDSGTVITRLVEPAYNAMRDSFRRQLSSLSLASPTQSFNTCYNKPSGEVEFPVITLHFDDGLDLALPVENTLWPGNEDGSVLCLAFALPPGGEDAVLSIFGNYQQQKFRIVHDVAGSRLGIASENCDA
ncbi:hypothetical protein SUGI_0229270 [Cryptomeria japonica]|nr:hypothetical protein SUGI_0229270 [Cryptomeria japonica]